MSANSNNVNSAQPKTVQLDVDASIANGNTILCCFSGRNNDTQVREGFFKRRKKQKKESDNNIEIIKDAEIKID